MAAREIAQELKAWRTSFAYAYVDARPDEEAGEDEENQWRDFLSLGTAFGSPADMRGLIELLGEVIDLLEQEG